MAKQIVIFAAEGVLAHEAIETLRRLDLSIAAAIVTGSPEWNMSGLANIVDLSGVSDALAAFPAIVPVWGPGRRRAAVEKAVAAGFDDFMTLVDPTAIVAQSARISRGVWIQTGANVGAGTEIGEFALINRNCAIGHHCRFDAYATTGGGATVASRCHVKEGAVLGAGCVLIPNRVIGQDAIVGAGAVVIREVADRTTVAGNPAKVIRQDCDTGHSS